MVGPTGSIAGGAERGGRTWTGGPRGEVAGGLKEEAAGGRAIVSPLVQPCHTFSNICLSTQ